MTASDQSLRCPDAEAISALAEGRLEPSRLEDVLAHVEHCETCMSALDDANAALRLDAAPAAQTARRTWWIAAAAAVLVIAGLAAIRGWRNEPSIAKLVDLAPRSARLIEPRLSGGFDWAEYRGPMRASGAVSDETRLRLGGAAADAIAHANKDSSADAQHVAGVAILLADDPVKAIERLRLAGERAPENARIASDLAAARYAAALALDRPSLYPEALDDADRALRLDARLPEALFNRALILERLGLTQEARRAWERYLAVDPSSKWAGEARRRAAKRSAAQGPLRFQKMRTWAEAETLGQWAEATLRGDDTEAASLLAEARTTGDALASATGERLLRDAVASIDRAGVEHRTTLARAHQTYRRGRMAYARQRLEDAERDLRDAADAFAEGDSPMRDVALYFAASARFDRHDVRSARESLEALVRGADAHRGYFALQAQTRWELALCRMYENDWVSARALLADAESLFVRLGETANLAFVRALLATTLISIGRPEEAWATRIRAFEQLSIEQRDVRLLVALGGAARMEQRAGRQNAARALLRVNVEEARAAGNAYYLTDALVRSALIANRDDARVLVREARAHSAKIEDPSLRERALADAQFAEGVSLVRDDPKHAIDALGSAIRYYDEKLPAFVAEPRLHRARALSRLGRSGDAMRDLESGIAAIERQPLRLPGEVVASAVLDAGESLFEDAIRSCLDRGDPQRAFAYAERARGHASTAGELQQRLRGTAAVVLHYTALPDEIVTFAVSADDFLALRSRFSRERFAAVTPSEVDLFDVLIRPASSLLAGVTDLIIVADPHMNRVPFAALRDARRGAYLIEQFTVSVAPSAAALKRSPRAASRSIVAVALPSGEREATQALPASRLEAEEIATLYPTAHILLAKEATYRAFRGVTARQGLVVHVAGHTETRGGDETLLRFAGGERVSWTTIADAPLDRSTVVVLAACETLSRSPAPNIRSLSLGGAFLAAGAGDVIGTLTPIADADARELFLAIHRQLAAGASPAEALRRAQLDAIASGRLPSWSSIALLTRCIRAPEQGGQSWATS